MKRLLCLFASLLLCAGLSGLAGCAHHGSHHRSHSLVQLLYNGAPEQSLARSETIELPVPLRVGLAFVPGNTPSDFPTEQQLAEVSEQVRAQFASDPAVSRIQLIPSQRLASVRGFDQLAELGRLYQVDVLALISYDQVLQRDYNKASLLYLTLVGGYFVKGNDASVQTFLETTVFDLRSRQLLFTASGRDARSDRASEVDAEKVSAKLQADSFAAASDQLRHELAISLELFRKELKDNRHIVVKPRGGAYGGHNGGGGSFPEVLILVVVLLVLARGLVNWLDRISRFREIRLREK